MVEETKNINLGQRLEDARHVTARVVQTTANEANHGSTR